MASNFQDVYGYVLADLNKNIILAVGNTVPADSTAGFAVGCIFQHQDGGAATAVYINEGTATSCAFKAVVAGPLTAADLVDGAVTSAKIDPSVIQIAEVDITKADILAMNATPVSVVAAPGEGKVLEFISATLVYDYDTAQYGGGGDVTLAYDSGGATVSNTVVKANSFGATGDKVYSLNAVNAAGGYSMPVNTALVITNATGAFTDPGTAAGVGRLKIAYRVIDTGL